MRNQAKVWNRAELTENGNGKVSKVIAFESGAEVIIPLNKDGSVKWLDDSAYTKVSANDSAVQ